MVLATGDTHVPPMESLRPGVVGYLLKPLKSKQVLAAAAQGVRWSADAVARGAHRQPRKRLGPAH
jgi:response regulator of citrate/malate metabolism